MDIIDKFNLLYQRIHDIYTNHKEYIIKQLLYNITSKGCLTILFDSIQDMEHAINNENIKWEWIPEIYIRNIDYQDVNNFLDTYNPKYDYILLVGLNHENETINGCSYVVNGLISKEEELNDIKYYLKQNIDNRIDEYEMIDKYNDINYNIKYDNINYDNIKYDNIRMDIDNLDNIDISILKTYNDYINEKIDK